jgi:hypothetical protein
MSAQLLAVAADMTSSVENAAVELVKTGVLGTVLVLIGAYAFWVTRQWNQAQKDRVTDQQEVTKTLIKFSTDMQDVLQKLKGAIDALKISADDGRKAIGIVDAALVQIDKTTDSSSKAVDALRASTDTIKDDARRAHDSLQRSVDDLPRRLAGH